jgi:hypothetical protein
MNMKITLMKWRIRSSRKEESKIAQGETLGERLVQKFPPRRGGVMRELDDEIQR